MTCATLAFQRSETVLVTINALIIYFHRYRYGIFKKRHARGFPSGAHCQSTMLE